MEKRIMTQTAPWPFELWAAVLELRPKGSLTGWRIWLAEEERGQDCGGLTLSIIPNNSDSYHPESHVNTRFTYPVPAAAYNRESWEEWIWARIEETEGHERAEGFCFVGEDGKERRPFKPAHPDGWNPGVVRSVVSETVVNTPNAGRLVQFPCRMCVHNHQGKMGEHFTIEEDLGCVDDNCACGKSVGARMPTEETGSATISINDLKFVVAPGDYSGMDIRHFVHPPLTGGLYLDNEGFFGRLIYQDEIVHIRHDMKFKTQ